MQPQNFYKTRSQGGRAATSRKMYRQPARVKALGCGWGSAVLSVWFSCPVQVRPGTQAGCFKSCFVSAPLQLHGYALDFVLAGNWEAWRKPAYSYHGHKRPTELLHVMVCARANTSSPGSWNSWSKGLVLFLSC